MNTFLVVYVVAQGLLLVFAIIFLEWQKSWYTHTNTCASIVTIVGVFGTFFGIYMGLQDFHPDPDKMQKGIEGLLQGLRHAFLTSLMGIGSAIALKTIALYQMRNTDEDPGIKAIAKTDDILNNIKTALSSTNGGTVFTELQALQKNIESSNIQLVQEISAFSDRIAEKCSLLLVEALKEVVRDYNMKINEQFGENFVQFNEGVREMNRWQEQYRQQMDELATEFRIAAESIQHSRRALVSMAESLMTIENQSETLVSIAETLDPLLHSLNNHLDAFRQLRQQTLDAFPQITERLNELTAGFSTAVQKAIDDSGESMRLQRSALTTHVREIQETVETVTLELTEIAVGFAEMNETLQKTIVGVPQNLAEQLESALQSQLTERLNELTAGFSTAVQKAIDDSGESMRLQRSALTTHVREIQETVETVTLELTEIIGQFSETNEALQQTIKDVPEDLAQRLESALQFQPQQFIEELEKVLEKINQGLDEALKRSTNIDRAIDAIRRKAEAVEAASQRSNEKKNRFFRTNSR